MLCIQAPWSTLSIPVVVVLRYRPDYRGRFRDEPLRDKRWAVSKQGAREALRVTESTGRKPRFRTSGTGQTACNDLPFRGLYVFMSC